MQPPTLLPHPELVRLDYLSPGDEVLTVVVSSRRLSVECPHCRQPAHRVHSRYQRTLAARPWNGHRVRIQLHSRRWFCDHPECTRRIFTEPLPGLVRRYAHRTDDHAHLLQFLAFMLGGEAGSRMAEQVGVPASPDTLLRQLRHRTDRTASPPRTPRVLGVDDFAFRRGQHYGTILIDLETGQPVDLLPDRRAETLAHWLQEHPGVEIISRDRSGSYAEGARKGAPEAQQVADRWHLLHNLMEAFENCLDQQRTALHATVESLQNQGEEAPGAPLPVPEAAEQEAAEPEAAEPEAAEPETVPAAAAPEPAPPLTRAEQERERRRNHRLACYEEVLRLHQEGYSDVAIAELTGKSRHTVRKYLRSDTFPEISRRQTPPTSLSRYRAYLEKRWQEGCHNATQLWRELWGQGYRGGYDTVRKLVTSWRKRLPAALRGTVGRKPREGGRLEVPSPRTVAWWLFHPREKLEPEQLAFREQLLTLRPELQLARTLVQKFFALARNREGGHLEEWIAAVEESQIPALQRFAAGLRRDWEAVVAGLLLEWSNGPVEGHVNRLKLIKRQMFGRASFGLLRARVLKLG
jgi:transposase